MATGFRRSKSAAAVAAVAMLTLAACSSARSGGSGGSPSADGVSSGSAVMGSDAVYNGPEANYKSLSTPKIIPGTKCSIGFQDAIASVPALKAQADAAQAEAAKLGCSFTVLDDMVNPTTQVNNFNQLLAQKVSAIIVFPVVTSSLAPSVAKANAAGVYVIGQSTPVSADAPRVKGFATNVLHMSDTEAFLRVQSVAKAKPGASFVLMGSGTPVELLQYYTARTKYWAAKFGLHFLGEVDATADDTASYSAAVSAIVARYPTVQALFTYSDNSAVGSATVLKASGKSDVLISGADGSAEAFAAIKNGAMFNTPQNDFLAAGRMLVDAAYDLITKQNLPLPANLGVPVKLITKDNVDTSTPIG